MLFASSVGLWIDGECVWLCMPTKFWGQADPSPSIHFIYDIKKQMRVAVSCLRSLSQQPLNSTVGSKEGQGDEGGWALLATLLHRLDYWGPKVSAQVEEEEEGR